MLFFSNLLEREFLMMSHDLKLWFLYYMLSVAFSSPKIVYLESRMLWKVLCMI